MRRTYCLFAAATLFACSKGGQTTPGTPAEAGDASESDTVAPSGDTGSDSGFADGAAPDVMGGYGPFVGTWLSYPGVPECASLIAVEPEASVGPLKWSACSTGRVGCRQLIVDWGYGKRRLEVGYPEPVKPGPSNQSTLSLSRVYNDPDRPGWIKYGIQALYDVDSDAPRLAIGADFSQKEPPPCGHYLGYGAYGFTAEQRSTTTRSVLWRSWSATKFESVTLSKNSLLATPVGDTVFSSITSRALHLETDVPRGIAVFDLVTREILTLTAPAVPLELPRAADGGTVARMIGPPWGLYFISDNGAQTQILATASGRAVLTHSIDRARGDSIVWAEGTFDFKNIELWESPLAKTMGELKPRKFATLVPWWGVVVANAGMVLAVIDGTSAQLIRVSDGARWSIKPEPGQLFKSAVWVSDVDAWLTTAAAADVDSGPSGIMRIRRDALAAPDLDGGT